MRENKRIYVDSLPIGYCEINISKLSKKDFSFQILYNNKRFEEIIGENISDDTESLICKDLKNELFSQRKLKSYFNVAVNNSYMEFQHHCKISDQQLIVKVSPLAKNQVSICFASLPYAPISDPVEDKQTNFFQVIDNSFDHLLIINKDLKLIYCNKNAMQLLGTKEIDSEDDSAFKYLHPDDITIGQNTITELLTYPNRIVKAKIRIKDTDNNYRLMSFRMKNLLDMPGIEGFVINAQDITDIDKSKQELQEKRNYLISLFNAIPNIIFVMDYQGNFLDIKGPDNDKLAYSPQQFLGKNISTLFPPYITNKLTKRLSLLKDNKPVDNFTYQRKNHLGENRFYECTLSIIDDHKVLALVNDVTSLKDAERTLENSKKDIQRKLDAIVSPEGNLADLELSDLVNIDELRDLFQTINDFTNIPITLLDRQGSVIFSLGTSTLCKNFHLAKEGSRLLCKESNQDISNNLKLGESKIYKCKNNIWNFASPVYVGGQQIATLDICQFRLSDEYALSEIDLRQTANLHKFDKEKYIESYFHLPVIDKERLIKVSTYYRDLLSKITALSYAQIKQARTAHQLKLREEKLAQITDNMTDVIFINDLNFKVLYVSPSIQKMNGLTPEEYMKRSPSQRFPQDTINKINSLLQDELAKGPDQHEDILFEMQEYNVNNDLIDMSVHAKLLLDKDNKPLAIIGSARDISHRKAIEAQLNNQLQLQSLLSSIAMKYINLPLKEIRASIQKSLEEFAEFAKADRAYIFKYDWDKRTTSNTYEWCREGISPQIDNLQNVPVDMMKEWNEKHHRGEIISIPEVLALAKNDSRRDFLIKQNIKSLISVPLMDKNECVGFVGFDSVRKIHHYSEDDITVLQVFANLLVNIRNRIKMTEALKKEKERATESDKLKSNLLKNISHEFRTPLNGIIGLSELLQTKTLASENKKMASMIYTSGIRLNYVLDSIMLLSQLESLSEKEFINLELINLSSILMTLTNQYRSQVEQKGLDFILDIHPNINTKINENLFKQAIVHIINNAIKYTKEGFIKISTQISQDRSKILLHIKDSGIGIPVESQEIIFSDFRQVSEGLNRAYEGCGLGLPIAKKAIELMKGSISLVSEFEKGAEFIISLPIDTISETTHDNNFATIANKAEDKEEEKTSNNLASILIVEDNKINQKLAISILNDNYDVDAVFDGESAIKMIAEKQYDLVLMDIHLGEGLDGLQTTKIIRNDLRYAKIPIIAVTGYTMLGDKEHILKQGCSHYISKPYSKQELLDLIASSLHKKSQ